MIHNWPEQIEEALRFDKNVCVTAGAGTGKTSILVEQYLALLSGDTVLGPLSVDEIVAITFTEKAAAEMKDRIRQEIEKKIESREGTHEKWQDAWRKLFGASITTIHSFSARLLRENPAEAQVDPHFSVMDERENQILLERLIQERVISAVQAGEARLTCLVEDYELRRRGRWGTDRTIEILMKLLNRIRGEGTEFPQLKELMEERFKRSEEKLQQSIDELRKKMKDLKELCEQEGKSDKFQQALTLIWPALDKKLSGGTDSTAIPDLQNLKQSLKLPGGGKVADNIKGVVYHICHLADPDEEGKDFPLNLPRLILQLQSRDIIFALIEELEKINAIYNEEKARGSLLDFDDLQIYARNLLRNRTDVRRRYKQSYRVILVDEFQDTNDLQREIVYYLAEDTSGEAELHPGDDYRDKIRLGKNRLFLVGDPKQSIYGFRGADVGVFLDVMKDVEKEGRKLFLQDSHRSVPPIISFTNAFFSRLMAERDQPYQIPFDEDSHLNPVRTEDADQPPVEVLAVLTGENMEEKRLIEARAIANRILRMVEESTIHTKEGEERKAGFRDIAILFRAMTASSIYEKELRRRNIPYHIVRGTGFYGCLEIRDLLNILRVVDSPSAEINLAGFLRSPMVSVSDETLYRMRSQFPSLYQALARSHKLITLSNEEKEKLDFAKKLLNDLKALKDRVTVAEMIERIEERTGFSAILLGTFQGEQKVANLRKLIEVSRQFEGRGMSTFSDFVRYLDELIQRESQEQEAQIFLEGSDCVKLMSVHQAKGLEFPIIFVADLAHQGQYPYVSMLYDRENGIGIKVKERKRGDLLNTELYQSIYHISRQKDDAERKRLFYVATTRARDHLVLSGPLTGGGTGRAGNTWAGWLDSFLKDADKGIAPLLENEANPNFRIDVKKEADGREYSLQVLVTRAEKVPEKKREPSPSLLDLHPELPDLKKSDIKEENYREASRLIYRITDFSPPTGDGFLISATGLAHYLYCQRKFFYTDILGIEAFPSGERLGHGLSALESGSIVHEVLERIDFCLDPERLAKSVDELMFQNPLIVKAKKTDLKEMKQAILSFLKSQSAKEIRESSLIKRELPLFMKLSKDGFTLYIRGIMDVIFAEGRLVTVMDYKYSRQRQEGQLDLESQLLIYALALSLTKTLPLPSPERAGVRDPQNTSSPLRGRGSGVRGPSTVRASIKFLRDHGSPAVDLTPEPQKLIEFRTKLLNQTKELSEKMSRLDENCWEQVDREKCIQRDCLFSWRCWEK